MPKAKITKKPIDNAKKKSSRTIKKEVNPPHNPLEAWVLYNTKGIYPSEPVIKKD